ncbi:hypothetical protein BKA70DRAFT_1479693 [Coprinopsis sp. MPI-PUGE-AT-0042]|nr:hypothetical protein BKA70DRAFT_1479693 [Coprinopsis sp. MPI-PUGE-AT-0042]
MSPKNRVDIYAHTDNGPLPNHLRPSLEAFLDQLDHQDDKCKLERHQIEESIEERYSRIRALKNEVEELQSAHNTLMASETSISEKKARYRGTVSALRRTPPEIVARIMAFAISGLEGSVGSSERSEFKNLRAVSRLWRQTALSTPYLWRSVALDPRDFSFTQHEIVDPHRARLFSRSLNS